MSFIQDAVKYGYQAEEILKFLTNNNPEFKKKASDLVKYGYTPAHIIQSVAGAFQGKDGRKIASKLGINPKASRRLSFSPDLDPADLFASQRERPSDGFKEQAVGAIGGAAIGMAAGGPVGAVSGAFTGQQSMKALVDSFNQSKQRKPNLDFSDYLRALLSASAKGAQVGFTTKFLFDTLKNVTSENPTKENNPDDKEQPGGQGQPIPDPTPDPIPPEGQQQPPQNINTAQEGFDYIQQEVGSIDRDSMQRPAKDKLAIITRRLQRLISDGVPTGDPRIQKLIDAKNKIIQGLRQAEKMPVDKENLSPALQGNLSPALQGQEKDFVPEKQSSNQSPIKNAYEKIFSPAVKSDAPLQKSAKAMNPADRSSNVQNMYYDGDTNSLRVLFNSGGLYEYENVSPEKFRKVSQGQAKPITEGSNTFGVWFGDKHESIGAAFHKNIKKNAQNHPFRKLEGDQFTKDEKLYDQNRKLFSLAAGLDPLAEALASKRRGGLAKALTAKHQALKNLSPEFVLELIEYLDQEISVKKGGRIKRPSLKRIGKELEKEFL